MPEQTQLDRIEQTVDELRLLLLGNGGVGICEDVRKLKALHNKDADRQRWVMRAVIAACLTAIGSVIVHVFKGG